MSAILRIAARYGPVLIAMIFVVAVLAKVRDMSAWAQVTSTLTIVPWSIRQWLPVLIPGLELICAYLLTMPATRQFGLHVALALLMAFTAFLIWRVNDPYAPKCHCFGLITLARDAHAANQFALARNGVLLALTVLAMIGAGRRPVQVTSGRPERMALRARPARAGAFTLPEILVVIGIIGIVIGLLIPTITTMRRRALLTQCSSNLRQVMTAIHARAADTRGYAPLAGSIRLEVDASTPWSLPRALNDTSKRRYAYFPDGQPDGVFNPTREQVLPPALALAPYLVSSHVRNAVEQPGSTYDWSRRRTLPLGLQCFRCPAVDDEDSALAKETHVGEPGIELIIGGLGYVTPRYTRVDYAFNEGLLGFHYDARYADCRKRGQLSTVRNASRVVVLGDAACQIRRARTSCWTPRLQTTGGSVTLADVLERSARIESAVPFDTRRHQRSMNLAFADGHVETVVIDAPSLAIAYLIP